jgi:predicted nucleotidyltransferase
LRVFGSVARGEETAQSDVDFLVEFPRGYDLITQRMPLAQKLADILNRKVELIPEHELNAHMRQKILAEAVSL